jgi:hypothetical protein
MISQEAVARLKDALALPEFTIGFSLHFPPGESAYITSKSYLTEYQLQAIEDWYRSEEVYLLASED